MSDYITTIGIEVHAELNTKTKMFCDSANDPDETRPNWNICPICTAQPGTLPTINKEAVRQVLRVGTAIGATLPDFSEFDRKNYFYPDLPKGYQISQYKHPLVLGGNLNGVAITRIHLEEDTARSQHSSTGSEQVGGKGETWIDFNRCGVALMELVTEPVVHSAKEAGDFGRELQLLLRTLGASDADMEKGQMRVEANISISKGPNIFGLNQSERLIGRTSADGALVLGTKVEVKNINSFRAMERAIEYEVARHAQVLERGEKVAQETRGWDEDRGVTFSQRSKENAHDYRYFPEPDLPKLYRSQMPEFSDEALKASLPELPWERRKRYKETFGLKADDVEMFVRNLALGNFFEAVCKELGGDPTLGKSAANYIASDLASHLKDEAKKLEALSPQDFAELVRMAANDEVSSRGAKDILAAMIVAEGAPRAIAKKKALFQKSDEGELKEIVIAVIAQNEKAVAEYKAGKEASLQYLVGHCMQASKGSGNPQVFQKLLKEMLY